jgi:hypothetical protein
MSGSNIKSSISNLQPLIPILIFVISFVPRIIGLGVFLTPDEKLLFENSADYLLGLLRGELGATFGWGYPGATTMALGAGGIALRYLAYRAGWAAGAAPGLGLADFVGAVLRSPVESVALGRLLVVLVVSLGLVAFYLLARRLVGTYPAAGGENSAFVAALLLALDPYILSYSRLLHNDILMAVFMTLSLLALLVYFRRESRGFLLLSGAMGGLALVTKTQALNLPAFVVLAVLLWRWRRPPKALAALAVWFAVAALVFWACWPAMWADPLGTVGKTVTRFSTEMQKGYGNRGTYFMDTISDDPGPLFYPLVFAFKGTLLLHLGLAAGLVWLLRGTPGAAEADGGSTLSRLRRRWIGSGEDAPERAALLVLGAYALLYMLAAFISAQKSPRYFLPVYPVLALLAARGLLWLASIDFRNLWRSAASSLQPPASNLQSPIAVTALLLQGALIVLLYHPYYFTYYNPLFGGGEQAARVMMIGWGEGLDRAARYLNGKPQAEKLGAASWYEWDFGSFFKGKTYPLVDQEAALRADYVIFYVNQVQRRIPNEHFVSYFRQREPEQVITMKGIEYAWIYAGPVVGSGDGPPCQHPVDGEFGGLVRLVCYEVGQARDGSIPLTLYWRAQGALPREVSVFLRLRDGEGNIHGRSERMPVDGLWPVERWEAGSLIRDDHLLAVQPDTPPGEYLLEVGLYDPSPAQALAASGGEVGPEGGIVLGTIPVRR